MKSLPLFIGWRYMRHRSTEQTITTMIKICVTGIFIGSFALALTLAIMNGFERVTHETMQNINAQIIIRSYGNTLDVPSFMNLFEKSVPAVQAWAPSQTRQVMIQNPTTNHVEDVVVLRGIDPLREGTVTVLEQKIVSPAHDKNLEHLLIENNILIGSTMARDLELTPGQTVELLFAPEEQTGKKINLDNASAQIAGVFETGIEEYDRGMIFCSLEFLEQLFPDAGVAQLNIKLHHDAHEPSVIKQLKDALPDVEVYSWKDLYPALVSALKLEKYVSFLVLALITLVASMNIISLLFMQVTHKRGDIAILQALGCPAVIVRRIFIWMGMIMSFCACIAGLVCAAIAAWLLEHYVHIRLPDVYYVTYLPARMDWFLLVAVFVVVMVLSLCATWYPARRATAIHVADVLRFEA